MHPYTLVNALITPMRVKPTLTYPLYLGVFSCQDPESALFRLQLFDDQMNLIKEETGYAPPVSTPQLLYFSAPGKVAYQARLYTDDVLTDLSYSWAAEQDTDPDYRSRAIYSSHWVSNLFPKAGQIVSVNLSARNVGRDGWFIACIHARDLYTLNEVITWSWANWQTVYSYGSATWAWAFTMPDADIILDFMIESHDPGLQKYWIDYAGYLTYLLEDSPRTLTLRSDKTEVTSSEYFTLSGDATRGGKPLANLPIAIYRNVGGKWTPFAYTVTDSLGGYTLTPVGNMLSEGNNTLKALGIPTWPGIYVAQLGGSKLASPPTLKRL